MPQHNWLWSQQDKLAGHVRRYCAKDLHCKITNAGFHVLEMRSFVLLLCSRIFRNTYRSTIDPFSELKLGKFANSVLESVIMAEYALGHIGVTFPGGGSLLLVARKE